MPEQAPGKALPSGQTFIFSLIYSWAGEYSPSVTESKGPMFAFACSRSLYWFQLIQVRCLAVLTTEPFDTSIDSRGPWVFAFSPLTSSEAAW